MLGSHAPADRPEGSGAIAFRPFAQRSPELPARPASRRSYAGWRSRGTAARGQGSEAGLSEVMRAKEVRQAAGIRKGHFIFVSAGGGGDGQLLMRTYVRAIRLLPPGADLFTLMAVGVNAPSAFASELVAEASGLPIRIVPYVDDSASCIAAADLVVCMAGYNTLAEVLYLKQKALVISRSGPSAEQTTRARLLVS